jgi:carboxypeptidase D
MKKNCSYIQYHPSFFLFKRLINLLFFVVQLNQNQAYDFHYHDYSQMTMFLHEITARYPTKAALYKIGQTEGDRTLWAVALSSYAPNKHILLRPEVKYIGNMHGNEVVGLEMLLYLIEYLLTSNDNQVVELMNQSRIWIMPSMNPDGLEMSQYGDCSTVNGR